MVSSRCIERPAVALIAAVSFLLTACSRSPSPPPPPSPSTAAPAAAPTAASAARKETFGTVPCGRLLAMEDVEAVFGRHVAMINILAEGKCVYEDKAGLPLVDVKLASGPGLRCTAQDGTYLGEAVEPIEGLADEAVWSGAAGTLCFVKGTERVQISVGAAPEAGRDPKLVATELARKAVSRLPSIRRPK